MMHFQGLAGVLQNLTGVLCQERKRSSITSGRHYTLDGPVSFGMLAFSIGHVG